MHAQSSLLQFIKSMKASKKGRKNSVMKGGSRSWKLGSILKEKAGFLAAVFSTLIFQLLLVFAANKITSNNPTLSNTVTKMLLPLLVLEIIVILLIVFVPMPPAAKFALFSVYSILTGLTLSVALKKVGQEVINTAIAGTATIFVIFLCVGLVCTGLGLDLSWLGIALFFALLLGVILTLVMTFMKSSKAAVKALAVFMLLVFAGYIVYDTNTILQRDYSGDFVTAAIDYFLDIINIFLELVTLFGNDQ
jgi:FtsH-binding integral membrane protein